LCAQDASPCLPAITALLTVAAIRQKDSHDKRILLARRPVAIICSAKVLRLMAR
jgi:hypothetical protein